MAGRPDHEHEPGALAPERASARAEPAAYWTISACSVILVGMKDANMAETELQRAMREACEQDAEREAERDAENAQVEAQAVQAHVPLQRENPSVLLVLKLEYTPEGRLVSATGCVGMRQVLRAVFPFGTEAPDVGELANETLRLGALGALLG